MSLLLSMAWRNIWRSPWRSGVVVGAMALGVWAGIFMMGLAQGVNDTRTANALDDYIGHAQITDSSFIDNQEVQAIIADPHAWTAALDAHPEVESWSERLLITAVMQSGAASAPVQVLAVDPEREAQVFKAPRRMHEGAFDSTGITLGLKLAEQLGAGLGDRVVLTFQDLRGEIHSSLYQVSGTYDGISNLVEGIQVYVPLAELAPELLGTSDSLSQPMVAHQIHFRVRNLDSLDQTVGELTAAVANPGSSVLRTWRAISPDLRYADEVLAQSLLLFMAVILFAMAFGILNTMLMAILERTRELGMLMAIGMTRRKVFRLVVLETLLLSFAGLPLGLLLGHLTIAVTSRTGISLAGVEKGMAELGLQSTIYPVPVPEYFLPVALLVAVLGLLSSLYPARKALKLNPIESMRVL
ncbi:MAG: FtsX-like permease family protein [Schleiferiaceae bacterium]|nr:FtsX-like permease family protein [Schleiferiaceae bacterium]